MNTIIWVYILMVSIVCAFEGRRNQYNVEKTLDLNESTTDESIKSEYEGNTDIACAVLANSCLRLFDRDTTQIKQGQTCALINQFPHVGSKDTLDCLLLGLSNCKPSKMYTSILSQYVKEYMPNYEASCDIKGCMDFCDKVNLIRKLVPHESNAPCDKALRLCNQKSDFIAYETGMRMLSEKDVCSKLDLFTSTNRMATLECLMETDTLKECPSFYYEEYEKLVDIVTVNNTLVDCNKYDCNCFQFLELLSTVQLKLNNLKENEIHAFSCDDEITQCSKKLNETLWERQSSGTQSNCELVQLAEVSGKLDQLACISSNGIINKCKNSPRLIYYQQVLKKLEKRFQQQSTMCPKKCKNSCEEFLELVKGITNVESMDFEVNSTLKYGNQKLPSIQHLGMDKFASFVGIISIAVAQYL